MKGKTAVVTGSTQGIGEAISRKLIQEGLSGLVICGRNEINGYRLEKEFNSLGCESIYVKADLENIGNCACVIENALSQFSSIDILVNSAAITDRATLLQTSPEFFDRMFAINTRAPFFLMQWVIKNMQETKTRGNILNIISMSSYGGQPFLSAYSASKGALVTLTKNTAFAYMRDGIRVNGINLGWADTPGEDAIQKKYHDASPNWKEDIEKNQPYGRLIKPEEVAELAAFILSEKSGVMTGAIIDYDQSVDGANYLPPRP